MRQLRRIPIRSSLSSFPLASPVLNSQYACPPPSIRLFSASAARPARRKVAIHAARPTAAATADPIQLRDYQEECIQSVISSLENGHKRVGISLATGSGKTVIFTQLIERIQPPSELATQTLIVAHRRELVEQAARHCARAYPGKTIEIEMGKLHASGTADVTIASLQSIVSDDRLAKFDRARFKLVLVDEAHHIVAPGYLKILAHLGLAHKRADSPALVGVSATFSRFDGLKLGAAIDEIVYHKDYVDMIGDKWLSDVLFTTVETSTDLSKVKRNTSGDFQVPSLSKAVNTDENNDLAVRTWFAKATGRKSTLVFCVDLNHVASLTQKFHQYGVHARFVTGDTPDIERSQILDDFRNGAFPVLVNCGVFTEGTDIPNIDCIILARPTQSRNLLVQMIGRGMRLHPGKQNCHIIDMVSSLETGIVTTPTLFGLDPNELVKEASSEDMRTLKEKKDAEKQRNPHAYSSPPTPTPDAVPRKVTFTEYDSVFDLISDTSGEKHIRSISQYAWVQVGPDRYVLTGPTGTYLRIERAADQDGGASNVKFVAWEVRALPPGVSKAPFAAPRELLGSTTLTDAVHGCDRYAEEIFPHAFISRKQRWRAGPPTDGQLKFLNKMRSEDDRLTAEDINKGKASDMITKIRHGARGRFASIEAHKRRKERQELVLQQARMRRMNEVVSVGPLSV
ncbi:p-loop containing nucleoside triphosphate hydrolase protein [Coniochaeta hoffmannii]|uniref:P-loop containing nucleoside triphosphate hydrolase protein n=1 Tax=Coniochaeta hoffmannii TaxID=91930 RepID=A0AA38R499_9PEZI|nr:p-loop containing nucleoside triphosphate hydrolase protein [Coniochaeta hoffmannii]